MHTDLLNRLRLPVLAAPMFLVSGPDLVVAESRAGMLGSFPAANCRTVDELDRWMTRIASALDGDRMGASDPPAPWGVNLITHRSNLGLDAQLEVVAVHRPPVVISALGSPGPLREVVGRYGGTVLADVTSVQLARKALRTGADGLICVSAGAGGHTGDLSPFAFASAVRSFHSGLLALGGGISDGWGVAAAIGAGADMAVLGTRLIAAAESLASGSYKQMLIDSETPDVIVSARITGNAASWLRPSLLASGLDPDDLPDLKDIDADRRPARWSQVWSAGQSTHAIRAVAPVQDIVDELADDFAEATARLVWLAAGLDRRHSTQKGNTR